MIAQITGELIESSMQLATVDVNGVGYELSLPLSTVEQLPHLHERVTLYTYLAVREDAMQLFGFITKAEKTLFRLIVDNVKGFGPRLALSVLSSMSVSAFCNAVSRQDVKLLSQINGVGKKSAAQLLLDLKGKLGSLGDAPSAASAAGAGAAEFTPEAEDAIAALGTLGFKPDDARRAVAEIIAESSGNAALPASAFIRKALSRMSAAK